MSTPRFVSELHREASRALEQHCYFYARDLPEGFDHLAFAQDFGKLMAQYDGDAIGRVRAKDGFDDVYHAQNNKELSPHTECYEFPGLPPTYLALWCVSPPEQGGGRTLLASLDDFFLGALSAEQQRHLERCEVEFRSTSGLLQERLSRPPIRHPIVERLSDNRVVYRLSVRCMEYRHDPVIAEVVEKFQQHFDSRRIEIEWHKNAFLIWNNHKLAHARTAFTDRRRELMRVWFK